MSEFEEIINHYSSYNIKADKENQWIEIQNQDNTKHIGIQVDEGIMFFTTQHEHYYDIDDLFESIDDYINDNKAAIEFYRDGKNRFGGSIETSSFDNGISVETVISKFGFLNKDFSGMIIEINSFSGKYDLKKLIAKDNGKLIFKDI